MSKDVYSLCFMCSIRCPIKVSIKDGQAVLIEGNSHAAGMATSLCPKGAAGIALLNDSQRVQYPQIREGQRGAGKWRRVSWDEALDYTAAKIKAITDQYGPESLVLGERFNLGTHVSQTFMNALGSPNYFSHNALCKGSSNTPLDKPFANAVTFRGTVEFPFTIAGRSGHQGLVALYSTKDGTEKDDPRDTLIPLWPKKVGIKNDRYYFAYTFDQYLYQSKENPREGFGLFGQFGISDGNPNRLYWSGHVGVGGVDLIPCRSRNNLGVGYYYAAPSPDLKDLLAPVLRIRDEHGWEIFYNFALTPWLSLGADVQIIKPSLASDTTVFSGLSTVIRF